MGMPRTRSGDARSGSDPFHANGRAFGILYGGGGMVGLVSIAIPHGTHFAVPAAIGLSVAALGTGAWAWRRRVLGPAASHALLAIASCMIAGGVYAGQGDPVSMSAAVLYVLVALGAGLFVSARGACAQVVFMGTAYGTALALSGNNAAIAEWLFVVGASSVGAWVTSRSHAELMSLATADSLTGLANRAGLQAALDQDLARAGRSGDPLTVAVIDLDDFKALNDAHGHLAGDRALISLVDAWSVELRAGDLLARFGGDEFVVVLPGAPIWMATRVLQRLHRAEARCRWSAGIATWDGHETAEQLLHRADQALYRAKQRIAGSWLAVARPAPAFHADVGARARSARDAAPRARVPRDIGTRRAAG